MRSISFFVPTALALALAACNQTHVEPAKAVAAADKPAAKTKAAATKVDAAPAVKAAPAAATPAR